MSTEVKIFNSKLKYDDIEIYGTPSDINPSGYNISDLLNIPHLRSDFQKLNWNGLGICKEEDHRKLTSIIFKYTWIGPGIKEEKFEIVNDNLLNSPLLNIAYINSRIYKDSILTNYMKSRDINEPVPNLKRIINSVTLFNEHNSHKYKEIYNEVQKKDVLCVHVRSADVDTEDRYINLIHNLGSKFKKVYLFTGIHLDERWKKNNDKIKDTIDTLNNIIHKKNNYYIVLANPDIHISLMSVAKNLLLYKGGFSMLGAIVCKGKIYIDTKTSKTYFEKIFLYKSRELYKKIFS